MEAPRREGRWAVVRPYRYDAFISYSRAVDGKLAPALQAALQRFAKPWYRMRALRVFRDDASLSASPALWSSIQEALDASRFFVLLASPEAAKSQWVQKEVEFWREHKPHERLLIALSDGAIHWNEASGDFDLDRTALPSTIGGVFGDEPRYTDLRWARREEQLTLDDPRFRNDVADIAAPLHGLPKDEMLGEDVRQHRRTVRIAISAIVLLAGLAVATGSAALFALSQRNQARAERDLATSRYLAAQAVSELGEELPRALLLGVEALRLDDTTEARGALLAGIQRPSPQALAFLEGHRGAVDDVAFTPDGELAVSASWDGSTRIWDVDRRRQRGDPLLASGTDPGQQNVVTSVAISPDGRTLASGAIYGGIDLWDLRRHTRVGRLPAHESWAESLAFSPDGRVLAEGDEEGAVRLWDLDRRRPLAVLRGHPTWSNVYDVAFSADGRILASAADEEVVLWDVGRRRQLGEPLKGQNGTVAFSPNGRMLASAGAGNEIALWDIRRRRRLGTLGGHRGGVVDIAFSPDGRTLVSGGGDRTISLWDLHSRERLGAPLRGHSDIVASVAFSSDGRTLASSGDDGTVILWDAQRREGLATTLRAHRDSVETVAFSPDGRSLASAGDDKTILVWDVRRRQQLGEPLRGHRNEIESVAFSPDGRLLASAARDDTTRLWDVQRHRQRGRPLRGHNNFVFSVAFSPTGQSLATAGNDSSIFLWDPETHRRQARLSVPGTPQSVAFSPDGEILASGNDADGPGTITLWSVPRRRYLDDLEGHTADVTSVAFSPNGETLASGSSDKTIVLWNIRTRRPAGELTGHRDDVRSVAFSPNGNVLASGGSDDRVILWDVERRQEIGRLVGHDDDVEALAFSPDGRTLASAGDDRTIVVWDLDIESWKRRACAIANRNLTRIEWEQFIGSNRPYHRTCPDLPAGAGAADE